MSRMCRKIIREVYIIRSSMLQLFRSIRKTDMATTMDMFPTTIAALGAQIEGDRLGLGTNLFSAEPALAEKVGMDTLNKEIRKRSIFYEQIAGKENIDDSVMDMD